MKACSIHDLYFAYAVEAFIILNKESEYKYMSPFSSLPIILIHLFYFYKLLVYNHDTCTSFRFLVKKSTHGMGERDQNERLNQLKILF